VATIHYRVHTQADPRSSEGVIFLTRGKRPMMRDYVAYAARLTVEYGTTIHAVYEGYPSSLEDIPVFESNLHLATRLLLVAENRALYDRTKPLWRVGKSSEQVQQYMTYYVRQQERTLNDLKLATEHLDVQGFSLYDPEHLDVFDVSRFMSHVEQRGGSDLARLSAGAMELASLLALCSALIPEMVAADPEGPCCTEPDFVVYPDPDPDRSYQVAKIVCTSCGHVLPRLEPHKIPRHDALVVEEAA